MVHSDLALPKLSSYSPAFCSKTCTNAGVNFNNPVLTYKQSQSVLHSLASPLQAKPSAPLPDMSSMPTFVSLTPSTVRLPLPDDAIDHSPLGTSRLAPKRGKLQSVRMTSNPLRPITEQKPGLDFYGIPNPAVGAPLRLSDLRERLIRQEETIIFSLIERAQFKQNNIIYTPGAFDLPHPDHSSDATSDTTLGDGSFSQYMLYELEKVHSSVRRYTSPDEHPFSPQSSLPSPILPPLSFPPTLVPNDINVNFVIEKIYRNSIIPSICDPGDDQNYGSSATCDAACLQALSKRVHYGKFIAEAKCQSDESLYSELAANDDKDRIWSELSDFAVEERLIQRVERKARNYGRDITDDSIRDIFKVEPSAIAQLYKNFIIPLTKEVEVRYVIHRYESQQKS